MAYLVEYEPSMRDEIICLLGDEPHKRAIWQWQFEASATGRAPVLIVAVDDGRIVGFNGTMSIDVNYEGRREQALWSCDFHVAEEYRGRGVGRLLKEQLIQQAPLVMSFGVSSFAAPVLTRLGWCESQEVRRFIKTRRPWTPRTTTLRAMQLYHRFRGLSHATESVEIHEISCLPTFEQMDNLWARVRQQYYKAVWRDGRYLHWRYEQHPLARYRLLRVDCDEGLVGLAVLRVHKDTVWLVDFLGELNRPGILRALIAKIVRLFSKAEMFTCTTTNRSLGNALLDRGFCRGRQRPLLYVRSEFPSDTDCETGWFVTSGDSDGEMLIAASDSLGCLPLDT